MLKTVASLLAIGALAVPLAAQATVYQFNATLSQANEVAKLDTFTPSSATGIATLLYNDYGTLSLDDDTFNFSMAVFGLTGPATAFHIHGAANTQENAGVRVSLDAAPPFLFLKSGGDLLVGGSMIPAPVLVPATPTTAVNQGYAAMSFLDMLKGHLAYVNVHTALNGPGEVRGQLIQVTAVPEPETYAMLLAGLGLVGWLGARRRKSQG